MQDIDTDENESFSSESEKLTQKVDKYFKESEGYIKTVANDWKEYERFYDGKQWRFSDGVRPVKNHIFKIIEGQLPLLTSARPSVDVIPVEESGFDKAKMLSSALSFVFEKQSLQLKNSQLFRSLLKTGTAFFYVDYDPDMANGQGDICIKEISWKNCFPDPNATNIDDCLYFGIKIPTRYVELCRKFPAYKEELKKKKGSIQGQTTKLNEYVKEDRWDGYGGIHGTDSNYQLNDMMVLEEMWHRDYETVPVDPEETTQEIAKEAEEILNGKVPDITQYEDHDQHIMAHEQLGPIIVQQAASLAFGLPPEQLTENDLMAAAQFPEVILALEILQDHIEAHNEYKKINPSGERPKYKNNLRLTIKVDDLILYDGEPPVEDGLIPVAPAYCYKDGTSFFATGEIKNIIDSQKEHNELGWFELQGLALNSNAPWVVDEEAQVDADTITNDPGLIIKKRKDGEIARLQPGAVSPQLAQKQQSNEIEMESIAGLPEASQGKAPAGYTAARAVIALQQAGNGRTNLKANNYQEYTLPRLARLCLSRIIKYWNAERLLRIYDDNGKIQFIKFDPSEIQNFEYDIKVVQGSSLGYDKGQLFDLMSSLVDSGKVPARVLFQVSDIPYRSKILEELEVEDQKNIAIQQLQEQILQLQALLQPANDGQGTK